MFILEWLETGVIQSHRSIYTAVLIHIKENTNNPVANENYLQKVLLGVAWASNWQRGRKIRNNLQSLLLRPVIA